MMKNFLLLLLIAASLPAAARKDTYNDQVQAYIATYKALAIEEQQRSGIPAAITLAQGIHETMAGHSELATVANNHFGIKCKKDWTGETFAHDDDAPQECFRKYTKAEESYKDHSNYLKASKRYASCFVLNPADYAAWAAELRKCGYATNPQYAQRLIKLIEDFHLQDYTYAALGKKEAPVFAGAGTPVAIVAMAERRSEIIPEQDIPKPDVTADNSQKEWGRVTKQDGVKGFWARKGEVLLEYAIQNDIRYAKLLELNGLSDAPLAEDRFVYLEKGGAVAKTAADNTPPVYTASAAVNVPSPADNVYIATKKGEEAHIDAETAPDTETAASRATTPDGAQVIPDRIEEASEMINKQPAEVTAPVADISPISTSKTIVNSPAATPVSEAVELPKQTGIVVTEEVPQDAFSRMKAEMDKAVYAPVRKHEEAAVAATAPVSQVQATAEKKFHTVATGDTAFGITKKYGITMQQLMAMNNLDFSAIKTGQKLRVK